MLDIYHSYLGLAALATMKEAGLREFDPVLCISSRVKENIEKLRKEVLAPTNAYWKYGFCFPVKGDDSGLEVKFSFNE